MIACRWRMNYLCYAGDADLRRNLPPGAVDPTPLAALRVHIADELQDRTQKQWDRVSFWCAWNTEVCGDSAT